MVKEKGKKKIMPPIYLIILLILEIGTHFIFPIKKVIISPYNYLGSVIVILGIGINIWADQIFKKEKTTVKPGEKSKKLVNYGPFKISRHPMYLGMFMILLGLSVLLGSLITFIFPLFFIIIMEIIFIPFEEKNMKKFFGKRYIKYKNKVRRWI